MKLLRFLAFPALVISSWAASPASYKVYETLEGKDGRGSAFVIGFGKTYLAVSSIHQFENAKAGIQDASGKSLALIGPTKRFDDVQIWELLDQSGAEPFLPYVQDFELKDDDLLAIRSLDGEVILGKVTGLGRYTYHSKGGGRSVGLQLTKPLDAAGMSGSPICRVSDGTVVGVLVGADKPEGAQKILFETLCLRKLHWEEKTLPKDLSEDKFSITTLKGVTYSGVSVSKSEGKEIRLLHDGGVAKINPSELDPATRRKVTGNISLLEGASQALAQHPDLIGTPKFSANSLQITIKGVTMIYTPLVIVAASGYESPTESSATVARKLVDSFKAITDQCAAILKLEAALLQNPSSVTSEDRIAAEKALIENYATLEKILLEQEQVVTEVSRPSSLETLYAAVDQLDGTIQGLKQCVVKPRLEVLRKGN